MMRAQPVLRQLAELVRVLVHNPTGGETRLTRRVSAGLLGRRCEGEEGDELAQRGGGARLLGEALQGCMLMIAPGAS